VAAPTLITATPPVSFASRSRSFSRSWSDVVSSIWARICLIRPSISFVLPAPSTIVVLSLSRTTFGAFLVFEFDVLQLDPEVLREKAA
jgi:hypothetical protein